MDNWRLLSDSSIAVIAAALHMGEYNDESQRSRGLSPTCPASSPNNTAICLDVNLKAGLFDTLRSFVLSTAIHEEIVLVDLARYGTNTTSKKDGRADLKGCFPSNGYISKSEGTGRSRIATNVCDNSLIFLFEFNQVVKHVIS